MQKIKTNKLSFTDESDRQRIFNGFNICDKSLGNEFRYNLDEEFFEKYRAKGFNLIRLGVQWANLEPEPEKYSESYLASIDRIFALAEKYGVYILLDMHQDLYSSFDGIGDGDGAPLWACAMDGHKPRKSRLVWAEAYVFGKWVHSSFDHFWNNDMVLGKGLQDRFASLWQMLAVRYGDSPALFGFDFLNEPSPGTLTKKLFLGLVSSAAKQIVFGKKVDKKSFISGFFKKDYKMMLDAVPGSVIRDIMVKLDDKSSTFDINYYTPFINRIAAAIRDVTPNGIMMIEQPYLCNCGIKFMGGPITVKGQKEPLQCFGPHAYDFTVDTPLYQFANADRVKAFFNEMRVSQMRLGIPAIVGEWGGCSNNKDTSWFAHANELRDYFDSNEWGQLYWVYFGDDLDSPLMQMLSRTYPVAIPGEIIQYGFDKEKKIFSLTFDAESEGEALIFSHAPCEVIYDGEAKAIENYAGGASLLSVNSLPGRQTITLKFN